MTSRRAVVGIAERILAAVFKKSKVEGALAHRFRNALAARLLGIGGTEQEVADILGCNGSRSLPLIVPDSFLGILTVFPSCLIIWKGPRRQGFASPRPANAPLTAPGRSGRHPWEQGKTVSENCPRMRPCPGQPS